MFLLLIFKSYNSFCCTVQTLWIYFKVEYSKTTISINNLFLIVTHKYMWYFRENNWFNTLNRKVWGSCWVVRKVIKIQINYTYFELNFFSSSRIWSWVFRILFIVEVQDLKRKKVKTIPPNISKPIINSSIVKF